MRLARRCSPPSRSCPSTTRRVAKPRSMPRMGRHRAPRGRRGNAAGPGRGRLRQGRAPVPRPRPRRYVPIDISTDYGGRRAPSAPGLSRAAGDAAGTGFSQGLSLPADIPSARRLFFYPGSSIGNLNPDDALAMLRHVRGLCPDGGLLIGVDRVKPREVLEPAYDDALRLTAAFNLNLLRHVNALLASDFRSRTGAMSPCTTPSARASKCTWKRVAPCACAGRRRTRLPAGERIHTENSYIHARRLPGAAGTRRLPRRAPLVGYAGLVFGLPRHA